MKQHHTGSNLPSVSSIQFPTTIPPQNIPPGMVPQIVGYMTPGANPQFLPINYFQNNIPPPNHQLHTHPTTATQSPVKNSPKSKSTRTSSSVNKANELKEKQPCKNWDKCTKTNYREHTEHGEKYYHPCKLGANCKNILDETHRSRFVHPCKFSSKCTKTQDKDHCLHYTHPCGDGTACQKYLSGDISHCFQFTHETVTHSNKNTSVHVSPWPTEWENPPKLSKTPLIKPHFRMVTLSTSSKEYQHASKLFQATSTNTILKIERIENYIRWNWYSLQKSNMKSQHNEKQLFHGTQQQFAELIAKEGFDARVSNSGKFGNGIYFSPDATYSLGYAGSNGRMFIVRVLVGQSYQTQSLMSSINMAPKGFDSVSGCAGKEIIVYDNKQAYPEYMITYQ